MLRAPLRLVLDTNIVLDWLVFADPQLDMFRKCVRDKLLVVLTHPLVSAEFARVLGYTQLKLDAERQAHIYAAYRAQTLMAATPVQFPRDQLLLPAGFPRCRDRDDELFLALAYHIKADALVSRDQAVLHTRRSAAKFAVSVVDTAQLNALLVMSS